MYGFDPPKILRAEIFAVLPEAFRQVGRGRRNPSRTSRAGTTLEGPAFDRAGNLYFTDIPNGRVFRVAPDAEVTLVAEYDGAPNGLRIHRDGRIFIADRHHGLMRLDPASGTIETLLRGPEREHFKGLNDLVFGPDGTLYFTDQGATGLHDPTGRVYRLSPDGILTCIIDTVPGPNGLVLDASGTVLFVAVTGAGAVWHVPMLPDGRAIKAGLFARLPAGGSDGLALDVEGNLAVANPGFGVVWLFNRKGLPLYRIDSPAGDHLTNMAYGGPDNRWLYVVEGDSFSILRVEMPFPGRPMFSHLPP